MFRENPTWWRIHCLIINAVDFLVDKMKTEQRKDPHMSKVIDYLLIKKEDRPSAHHLDLGTLITLTISNSTKESYTITSPLTMNG